MTNEQRNILNFIMENKKVIEEIINTLPKEKLAKDLEFGDQKSTRLNSSH